MKINTEFLMDAEKDFRLYRNRVEIINDDVRAVLLKASSIEGMNEIKTSFKKVCFELETLSHIFSQMSCFLEMAAETYNSSEEKIIDKRSFEFGKDVFYYIGMDRSICSILRYADTNSHKTILKKYKINEVAIKNSLNSRRKKYFAKSLPNLSNKIYKTRYLFTQRREFSDLSIFGKIF